MKLYKVFLLLIVISGSVQAQDLTLKKHEIGLSIFSSSNASMYTSAGDAYLKYLPNNNFVNAILYRHHFKKNVLRAGLSYQYHEFPNEIIVGDEDPNQLYYGNIWGIEAKLGVEHSFGNRKLKPYVAIDTYLSIGKNSGVPGYVGGPTIDIYIVPPTYGSISGGFSPALGLTYQVSNQFSIRIETSSDIGWYRQSPEYKGRYILNGFYLMYNPVSTISVNFHF